MSDEKKCADDLIQGLCDELKPVCVMQHPLRRILPWLAFALIYITGAVWVIGIRDDIVTKLTEANFYFEMGLVTFMAFSAALCSTWLCVPDMRGQRWILAIPFTLLAVFMSWTGLHFFLDDYVMPKLSFCLCFVETVVNGIIPIIALIFLTVRGKTTHPFLLATINTIAIGGFGYIASRLTCMNENMGHICFSKIFPYIVIGLILSLVARRIYRW